MSPEPAFFTIDRGTATTSAALIGRVAGRWRLLGSAAFPASVELEPILGLLVARLRDADPDLAEALGAGRASPAPDGHSAGWPRLEARTTKPRTLAILAPNERRRATLVRAATGSGWRIESGSLERTDPLGLMTMALARDVDAVLLGAGVPPSPDERRALRILAPLVAAVADRRPELSIVLAGAAAQHEGEVAAANRPGGGKVLTVVEGGGAGPSEIILRETLGNLRADTGDARRALIAATATLAAVLDRRVETVEVGLTGGTRAAAGQWFGREDEPPLRWAIVASAGFARPQPDDALVDGMIGWSSVPVDRSRLRDRLRELWLAPWAEAHGEGALLRLTAARAALDRLVEATPEFADVPSPDVLVVSGGLWSVAPPPAIALAVMDVVRRAGVSQLAWDHARILAPIGTVQDPAERAALLADLADDVFVPLGTAVLPQGVHSGRYVGRALIHRRSAEPVEQQLVAGGVVTLEVPPGESGAAEFDFRDSVVLGARGRRFAVDVAGGMGGVLVDLRDVPLRLPEEPERRRELLAGWQGPLWRPLDG